MQFVLVFLVLASFAYAVAPPPFMMFDGTAKMNGTAAPDNMTIMAFIQNDSSPLTDNGLTVVKAGKYMISVVGTDADTNKTIYFYLGGEKAAQSSRFTNMGTEHLDLTVDHCIESWNCSEWSSCSGGSQARTCNELNCNVAARNETQTCGSNGNTGGGGGGGGGGGSSEPKCAPAFSCKAISSCSSMGKQTEICTDSKCNSASYTRSVSCTYTKPSVAATAQPAKTEATQTPSQPKTEAVQTTQSNSNSITGAVVG